MAGFFWIGSKIISKFYKIVRPNVDNTYILKTILKLKLMVITFNFNNINNPPNEALSMLLKAQKEY